MYNVAISLYIFSYSPQVALKIMVPKLRSPTEKVALLALTVSLKPFISCRRQEIISCSYIACVYGTCALDSLQYLASLIPST